MVFSSTVFLFLFLPTLLLLYYLPFAKSRTWRNTILLIFSIGFYAWGEPVFVFLMLFSIFVNWLIGLKIVEGNRHKKVWMISAIAFDIVLIGVFKYASFLSRNLAALAGNDKLIIDIALPIGISFFTFQLMSYVFDVYYGSSAAQKNPFYVALYISLFPQLIAGPIVRYQQIENEITDRKETFSEVSAGMRRFIYGLGKKVLLANFLAQIADNVFDYLDNPSVMMAWLGAIAYSLQIYFDFSGYSDMAIGLGRMFGFHFEENFNYSFTCDSINDFWRRQHISLSQWFRDYVYIPLGGSRVSRGRWVWNMFVVWILTGIWHGANWTFILWGFYYFLLLLFEKFSNFPNCLSGKADAVKHIYALFFTAIGMVMFRASSLTSCFQFIQHMFGIGTSGFIDATFYTTLKGTWVILVASMVAATPFLVNSFQKLSRKGYAFIEQVWLLLVFTISIVEIVSSSYNPFIYFNF